MSDFYFTGDDYRYRFRPDCRQRFIYLIRERSKVGVTYKGRVWKWDTVIQEKTNELSRYLNGRSPRLDFSEPTPIIRRTDSRTVREAILCLTQAEAEKSRIGKSTFRLLASEG